MCPSRVYVRVRHWAQRSGSPLGPPLVDVGVRVIDLVRGKARVRVMLSVT